MKTELKFLLERVQNFISDNYSSAIVGKDKQADLRGYIEKYLRDKDFEVDGFTREQLVSRLFYEMAAYSILTPYLDKSRTDIEEININSWDDVAITYTGGRIVKTEEHFLSPQHAVDVCKRLLQHSGMVIDSAMPVAFGDLPGNTRISVMKDPVVGTEQGVSASIRILHPSDYSLQELISDNVATEEMISFLCMCLRYGVSFVIAGAGSSGKTTLLNALLKTVPDSKRVFSIEAGSRELSMVKRENGRVVNNVVGTLSRPSDNPAYDISQEDLVKLALRFHPDIIVVGEMLDTEACSAVEAAMTGHPVISTIHATAGEAAHERLSDLYQKRYPIAIDASVMKAARAFPVVVYTHQLEDTNRKIMDISECVINSSREREYHTLYRFLTVKNDIDTDGRHIVQGYFEKGEKMSKSLENRLVQAGVPYGTLQKFL